MGGHNTRNTLIGGAIDPVNGPLVGAASGHGKHGHPQAQGPATPPPNVNYQGFTPPPAAQPTAPAANWWGGGGAPPWAGQGGASGKGQPPAAQGPGAAPGATTSAMQQALAPPRKG